MSDLKGKVALVTGASRGIGRSIALRLAKDGADVVVHYGFNQDKAIQLVEEIQSFGGKAFAVQANLGKAREIKALFQKLDSVLKEWDKSQFDILVNNAGIGQESTIESITEESYDEVMDLHVKAPLFIIQNALSRLNDGGRIINISSTVTRIALPNLLGYSISKGAINTLTFVLAQQLGSRKITVNAISPGFVNTDMNEAVLSDPNGREFAANLSVMGRWAETEDIADIGSFLAGPDSRWITGQILDASGGSRL
ncbi:SDR family oxidoreductase [Shimazuella alba]|uniref:SDR family oxidoreductase n=1 Tax=Shimazuella alba TaxID=2690964 RepID=A0A6I4VWS5_9BACL|nr:SDR family oxidoreductase [Shimazuella alba]MXQ52462.1 SDR family oxidoreductase [Shimazuella alba]